MAGVVQILLAAKANVNIPLTAVNRYTPLHAAASAGCEDVVSQLCQAGTSGPIAASILKLYVNFC